MYAVYERKPAISAYIFLKQVINSHVAIVLWNPVPHMI